MLLVSKTYKSKAKINLFLHILFREDNGFHNLQSIAYFPNIYDELTFSIFQKKMDLKENSISSTGEFSTFLPQSKDNSIIKVISYFQETFDIKEKIQVDLVKNLAIGGGIGGGSSNTAVTIIAMNDLLNLNLSFSELLEIAKKFGSDVPVCLYQKSCIFEGKGEITNPIDLPNLPILLINPKEPLLTGEVFKQFDNITGGSGSKEIKNLTNLNLSNYDYLINFLKTTKNDLLEASISLNENIAKILNSLENTNPVLSRMSGSGSTCFAIYKNHTSLLKAKKEMQELYPNSWIAIS